MLDCPNQPLLALAQSRPPVSQILAIIGVLIVLAVVGGLVIQWARTRLLRGDDTAERHAGVLEELRQMRRRGELSDEEYERARERTIARLRGEDPSEGRRIMGEVLEDGSLRARAGYDLTGEPLPPMNDRTDGASGA